jgi:hypothetical protein
MSRKTDRPAIVPDAYVLLSNWRYLEHSLMRILAGWGRSAVDWEDKLAACEAVWLQADATDRLRRRLGMFPGGRMDGPVHPVFERVTNQVLLAPGFAQAMAAVHRLVQPALIEAYQSYAATTHPVHDRPTHLLLRELIELKRPMLAWYEGYRARHPHHLEPLYAARVSAALAEVGSFTLPIEAKGPAARPCGAATAFAMPKTPGRRPEWEKAPPVMPLLAMEWNRSAEARRLWFMIGYLWEMGVAEQQLAWIYYGHMLPFEWQHAEARHLWDESRHGDSGLQRLRDFGLDLEHVGYTSYGKSEPGAMAPLTPRQLYDEFFHITQVAETGFFATKRYCFQDMLEGGDDASAEMFQFDIIDETSHVEYGHQWLPVLAGAAQVEEDYRQRGARERQAAQARSSARMSAYRQLMARGRPDARPDLPPEIDNDSFWGSAGALFDERARDHCRWLRQVVDERAPLRFGDEAPLRPDLPM